MASGSSAPPEVPTTSTSQSHSDDEREIHSPGGRSQASAEDDPDSLDLTGHNPTRDAIAEGIVSLLSPTLKTLDEGVLATKRSQENLSEQIALLTEQLKLISAEQVCPIDLDGYVDRLGTIKGKINVISSVLQSAQERLNRIHEQAIKEAARRKPLLEPSPVTSPTSASTSQPETQNQEEDNNQNSNLEEEETGEPSTESSSSPT